MGISPRRADASITVQFGRRADRFRSAPPHATARGLLRHPFGWRRSPSARARPRSDPSARHGPATVSRAADGPAAAAPPQGPGPPLLGLPARAGSHAATRERPARPGARPSGRIRTGGTALDAEIGSSTDSWSVGFRLCSLSGRRSPMTVIMPTRAGTKPGERPAETTQPERGRPQARSTRRRTRRFRRATQLPPRHARTTAAGQRRRAGARGRGARRRRPRQQGRPGARRARRRVWRHRHQPAVRRAGHLHQARRCGAPHDRRRLRGRLFDLLGIDDHRLGQVRMAAHARPQPGRRRSYGPGRAHPAARDRPGGAAGHPRHLRRRPVPRRRHDHPGDLGDVRRRRTERRHPGARASGRTHLPGHPGGPVRDPAAGNRRGRLALRPGHPRLVHRHRRARRTRGRPGPRCPPGAGADLGGPLHGRSRLRRVPDPRRRGAGGDRSRGAVRRPRPLRRRRRSAGPGLGSSFRACCSPISARGR